LILLPWKDQRWCYPVLNEDFLSSITNAFTIEEMDKLQRLKDRFLSKSSYEVSRLKKEEERCFMDLLWKSAELEENTYSRLQAANLLEIGMTAAEKGYQEE
jgi:hypothetical protein